MSHGKRYTDEFKVEADKQITERGYSIQKVAARLGISTKSLYNWRSQRAKDKKMSKSPRRSIMNSPA